MSDPRPGESMYGARAALYDRIYSFKDYAAEAARVRSLLAAAGVPDGARVVEAACGTGNYLLPLSRHYAVEGFDLSPDMLEIARAKVPGAALRVADMRDFAPGAPADALLCLFSSIGYVEPGRLADVAACFHRALRPGGVGLVEGWITPEAARPGHMSVQTWDGLAASPPEPMKLVRAATHLVDGRRSVLDFHWLVLRPEGVEHFTDRHEVWISTADELLAVFRGAGFEAEWLEPGPVTGRGSVWLRRPA